jgi:hypothetical protein
MASISRTLPRIKQDIAPYLPDPWIVQACQEVQHRWRRRQFDPVQTLHLFLLQILCFNTALNHLRHLSKLQMTAAGFCKARKRLPLAVLQRLLRRSAQALRQDLGRRGGFCGLRAYLVDGSSTITPDTPALDQHFGHPTGQKQGCSLPVPTAWKRNHFHGILAHATGSGETITSIYGAIRMFEATKRLALERVMHLRPIPSDEPA